FAMLEVQVETKTDYFNSWALCIELMGKIPLRNLPRELQANENRFFSPTKDKALYDLAFNFARSRVDDGIGPNEIPRSRPLGHSGRITFSDSFVPFAG